MTPEQRLAIFSAQTSEDFIAKGDAVGLLFDMISHQNEFDKNSRISDE